MCVFFVLAASRNADVSLGQINKSTKALQFWQKNLTVELKAASDVMDLVTCPALLTGCTAMKNTVSTSNTKVDVNFNTVCILSLWCTFQSFRVLYLSQGCHLYLGLLAQTHRCMSPARSHTHPHTTPRTHSRTHTHTHTHTHAHTGRWS